MLLDIVLCGVEGIGTCGGNGGFKFKGLNGYGCLDPKELKFRGSSRALVFGLLNGGDEF